MGMDYQYSDPDPEDDKALERLLEAKMAREEARYESLWKNWGVW